MKSKLKWATLLLVIAVIGLVGCENPIGSLETPDIPDTEAYIRNNSPEAQVMKPVIVEPAYAEDGIDVELGSSIKIRVMGGVAPLRWYVEPDKGYVILDPEDSLDARTFLYVAEKPGKCVVYVADKRSRVDYIEINNK
jgi:hypothetical protein